MKTFGLSIYGDYGVECGLIIAESEKEAIEIVKNMKLPFNSETHLTEISTDKKGYTVIGQYEE